MMIRNCFWLSVAILAFAMLPGVSRAASKAPAGGLADGAVAPAAEVHAPESPQVFDLPARWDLSIYTLVVFILLFLILRAYAWPAILAGMRAREQAMIDARDQAIAAKVEAEAIRTELQSRLAKAHDEVRAMMDEARKDAAKLRADEREVGVQEAAQERERATREITSERDQALQEIYQKSVALASLMSSKAIRRELSASDHNRLLDESLAELAGKAGVN